VTCAGSAYGWVGFGRCRVELSRLRLRVGGRRTLLPAITAPDLKPARASQKKGGGASAPNQLTLQGLSEGGAAHCDLAKWPGRAAPQLEINPQSTHFQLQNKFQISSLSVRGVGHLNGA